MFKKFTAEQYRAMSIDALNQQRDAVADLLENPVEGGPTMEELRSESALIRAEFDRRNAVSALRSQNVAAVAGGAGVTIDTRTKKSKVEISEPDDPFATPAYNMAFMRSMQTGEPIPDEFQLRNMPRFRENKFTTVEGGASKVVPTNLVNRIVQEEQEYGTILPLVNRTSYPGGIAIPTADINPTATWITEKTNSDDQEIEPGDPIVFGYYGLQCKLAQSYLSNAITLSAFQDQFVTSASKAMIEAKETGILFGTGTGQMLGITKDTRVPSANKLTMTATEIGTWAAWSNFKKAIKLSYRRGRLVMNKGTFDQYIDGMVDNNGQPVARVNMGINGEEVYRFRGIDVLLVDDWLMKDFESAAATDVFAIFQDFSRYMINSALPLMAERWSDPDNNKVKNKLLEYLDGKLVDPFGTVLISKADA